MTLSATGAVGVDEAGYGNAAGVMFAASVYFYDPKAATEQYGDRVKDSKKYKDPKELYRLAQEMQFDKNVRILVVGLTPECIDHLGGGASRVALFQSLMYFGHAPKMIIDGNRICVAPPSTSQGHDIRSYVMTYDVRNFPKVLPFIFRDAHLPKSWVGRCPPTVWEPKADGKYLEVAAASVMAKHFQLMNMGALHRMHPDYGFNRHHGYLTPEHRNKIRTMGVLPNVHRSSYLTSTLAQKE